MRHALTSVGALVGGALLVLALTATARPADAFPIGSQFDLDALTANGAGGVAFTGAPRFAGHACAVCHTGAPGRVGARLGADPVDLFASGYTPGTTYHLEVALTNPWAAADRTAAGDDCGDRRDEGGGYSRCDDNGFALEIDDGHGQPVGTFAPRVGAACAPGATDAAVRVLDDHSAVTHNGFHHGLVRWDLCWTAPAAATGALTAYLAVVDGNGGDGTPDNPNDMTGDDTFAGAVALRERGGVNPAVDAGGCTVGDAGGGGAALTLALAGVLGLGARVRRRRRRLLAAALLLALVAPVAGCVHVKPFERELLAKRKMVFAPDPKEDELDLHMQEAREGSSGGYGSAGGGCGCN